MDTLKTTSENSDKANNTIAIIRAITRSLGLLIPLIAVCIGIFVVTDIRDTLVGGLIGILGTAGIFYYEAVTE